MTTYRDLQKNFEKPKSPFRKFGNPAVVCEGWYASGRSKDFKKGSIKKIQIGSTDLVIFRDLSGTLRATEANCPHLGADLTKGRLVEKGLQCGFHSWCWGEDGLCTAGGGVTEGRRILTFPVQDRWGVVWIWAGKSPQYDLPDPAPANSRHILLLPPQILGCHPHFMLGNGLDFSHVGNIHGFQLMEDPVVNIQTHHLSANIHGRFSPTWLRRALLLQGQTAKWRFTTIGPSFAWLTVQSPTPFELAWAATPLPDGRCASQTVLFLPNYGSLIRALPMMIATTWADKKILQHLRFQQGFVSSDAVFYQYARMIEGLPEWKPEAQ